MSMITVRLDADLHEKFCMLAQQKGVSMNQLAVQLMEEAVKKQLSSIGHQPVKKSVCDNMSDPISRSLDPHSETNYPHDADSEGGIN